MRRADILVVGQGLAGSLLAWELERAEMAFAIADGGHESAATAAAAGIINPITGRRLVKSWRVEALLPQARATYQEIEDALGIHVWHEMRVRRLFADERERATCEAKRATGELAPYAGESDTAGFWIEGAARVDLGILIAALRGRWRRQGRLREEVVDVAQESLRHELVIDCSGMRGARSGAFGFVPWEFSKGEVLELAVEGLAADVVLNRRHWVAPAGRGAAWAGATHEPGVLDSTPTAAARATLEASVRGLLPGDFSVTGQRAGVRVNLPDKLPVLGRHPGNSRLGVINGLGAKGALFAPVLAPEWGRLLRGEAPVHPEFRVERFWQ